MINVNCKGLNFIIETIFVLLLILVVLIFFVKFNLENTNNIYLINTVKSNDLLVIFSNENRFDRNNLIEIMSFYVDENEFELYVNNEKYFGNIEHSSECIVRSEFIFVEENGVLLKKQFKIKSCS